MPWDKQFDVDDALDRALETFWEQGYEATSMQDLLGRMGINRGSFYDTYKSKHDVLIESLRRYDREYRRATLRRAGEGRGPREAVTAVFRSMIENTCGPGGRRGCFLVNSALELAPKDPAVARIVRSGFRDVERFFTALIERGKADGELPRGLDTQQTARALMCQLLGLMVLIRSGAGAPVLVSIADRAGEMLG